MNYILFNSDGSIKKTNFTDSIQQNDDGSNSIFVSVDGLDFSAYTAVGVFVLPDGTVSEEGADFESDYEYASGKTADGFVITITLNETKLAGIVFLTLQIIEDATNKAKYTYRVALTINKSADLASVTLITLAQYNALKSYIDSNFIKDDDSYVPYSGATNDVNLGTHKIVSPKISYSSFYIELYNANHEMDFSGSGTYRFYGDTGDIIFDTTNLNNSRTYQFPDKNGTLATTEDLPKKNLIGTFNTSSFVNGGSNYSISDVALSGFIANSDLLIITWDNCFAICPIPQSGPGRVCAAMWNANGEAQIIRIRYELKDNNTKLDISLQGGFTPPTNHTAYIFNYKLV